MKIPKPNFCLISIIVLIIIECALVGYIAWWREGFWSAVSHRDLMSFILYVLKFTVAALMICYVSGKSLYLTQYVSLIYRRNLTRKAFRKGMIHYHNVEGKEQRIQEDCASYPLLAVSLLTDLFRKFLNLGTFVVILLIQLSGWYLLIPLTYAIIGTCISRYFANPLISLNYTNQLLEAKFRQMLTKNNYAKVHRNNTELFLATKKLSYFQYFYGQISVIIPYIVLYPVYFTARISFGVLMQCANILASIIDALSYIVNSYNDINKWLSCRRRLKEINLI